MRYYTTSSGGLTSLITGGDPLQGAVQGLVVYFANHLAHPGEGEPKSKSEYKKIEGSQADTYDGKLTDDMDYIWNGEEGNYLSRFAKVFSLAWSESTSMEKFGFVASVVPQKTIGNGVMGIVKSSKSGEQFIKGIGSVSKDIYHGVKKSVIGETGIKTVEKAVGGNPDLFGKNGTIWLKATFQNFKGKVYNTGIKINKYFNK